MKQTLAILALLVTAACAGTPAPVVTPVPPAPTTWLLQVTIRGAGTDAALATAAATLQMDLPAGSAPIACVNGGTGTPGRMACTVPVVEASTTGGFLAASAPGYQPNLVRISQPDANQPDLYLSPVPVLPPAPTRDALIHFRLTFQGLTVTTQQLGTLTWFEPFLGALTSLSDREAVYAAKHAQGDTHAIVECFSSARPMYNEAPYAGILAPDCDADLPTFRALVEDIIQHGFIPVIAYDGDNGDNTPFGSANALAQLPVLANLLATSSLGDLNPYVCYARLWDSVFYGSSPANIAAFGAAFRQVLPNGCLAIEGSVGHIPVGGGPADYAPGGQMTGYDVVLMEFADWPATGDGVWQILARLLGPAYVRPPDQPAGDDARPPFYLATPSARGPYAVSCFEWAEYGWTHGQTTAAQIAQGAAYYAALGCTNPN